MTTAPTALPRVPRLDGRALAIAGVLALSLAVALLSSAWAGAAILAFGLVVIARPFDPLVALLLVAGTAAFAGYGDLNIQRDLMIVSALTGYLLVSWFLAWLSRQWAIPETPLTPALIGLMLTTAIASARGLASGTSIRYAFLEVFPLASLLLALVIGGIRIRRSDLPLVGRALIVVALASASLGYLYYAAKGVRTQGVAYSPVPGLIALILLTRMLYERTPRPRLSSLLLFCVLIGHQVLTFTRGYWLSLMVAVPVVFVIYAWRGPGAGERWRKVLYTSLILGVGLLVMAVVAIIAMGGAEYMTLVADRFASSFDTENKPETVSNIVRLVELRTTMKAIIEQPLLGYGHGATLIVRQFFYPMTGPQWWVHQSYVMMWYKQGAIGLAALLWVIVGAMRTGLQLSRNPDRSIAAWGTVCVSGTLFIAMVALTNYHFFMVTLTFLAALLWGIAMSLAGTRQHRVVWRRLPTSDSRAPD